MPLEMHRNWFATWPWLCHRPHWQSFWDSSDPQINGGRATWSQISSPIPP